jgi:hypothetical protein
MQLLGLRSRDVSDVHGALQRRIVVRPITRFVNDSGILRHTPIFDASVLTSQYFQVKDIVANKRRQQQYYR